MEPDLPALLSLRLPGSRGAAGPTPGLVTKDATGAPYTEDVRPELPGPQGPYGLGEEPTRARAPPPHQGTAVPASAHGCPGLSGATRKCPSLSGGGRLLPYPPAVKLHQTPKGCFRDKASPAKPSRASPVPGLTRPGEAVLTSG